MEKFISGGKIEICKNPDYRIFHMRHQLVKKGEWISTEYHDELGRYPGRTESNALPLTMTTIKALYNIPGIESVDARPYNFSIEKAPTFTWEELMPKIILEMSKYLPATYS